MKIFFLQKFGGVAALVCIPDFQLKVVTLSYDLHICSACSFFIILTKFHWNSQRQKSPYLTTLSIHQWQDHIQTRGRISYYRHTTETTVFRTTNLHKDLYNTLVPNIKHQTHNLQSSHTPTRFYPPLLLLSITYYNPHRTTLSDYLHNSTLLQKTLQDLHVPLMTSPST